MSSTPSPSQLADKEAIEGYFQNTNWTAEDFADGFRWCFLKLKWFLRARTMQNENYSQSVNQDMKELWDEIFDPFFASQALRPSTSKQHVRVRLNSEGIVDPITITINGTPVAVFSISCALAAVLTLAPLPRDESLSRIQYQWHLAALLGKWAWTISPSSVQHCKPTVVCVMLGTGENSELLVCGTTKAGHPKDGDKVTRTENLALWRGSRHQLIDQGIGEHPCKFKPSRKSTEYSPPQLTPPKTPPQIGRPVVSNPLPQPAILTLTPPKTPLPSPPTCSQELRHTPLQLSEDLRLPPHNIEGIRTLQQNLTKDKEIKDLIGKDAIDFKIWEEFLVQMSRLWGESGGGVRHLNRIGDCAESWGLGVIGGKCRDIVSVALHSSLWTSHDDIGPCIDVRVISDPTTIKLKYACSLCQYLFCVVKVNHGVDVVADVLSNGERQPQAPGLRPKTPRMMSCAE